MIAAVAVAGVLLATGGWVVVRGLMAREALTGALPLVRSLQTSVIEGDTELGPQVAEVQRRTAEARALTSDPVWRALEVLPWVGGNLSAFREAAAAVDDVAVDALPPLADLAGAVDPASLTPRDGAIDLEPIIAARPALATAADALQRAEARVVAINTDGTLPQLAAAVAELRTLLVDTSALVSGLDGAAQLLPGMLGADEPRSYLVMFLTNAEVRAGGGIPGALAELVADNGRIEIIAQDSAGSGFDPAPTPLTDTETLLFNEVTGLYLQNVTATPQFERSAELARAMWAERTGRSVDGVVSIDVPALAGVLNATGPVPLAPGNPFGPELTGDRAVSLLLSEVYASIPRPADQDAFFADTARRAFEAITAGAAQPDALLKALATATADRRLAVWSSDATEQALLAQAGLTPDLPRSAGGTPEVGVFLNDSTGAKMDYHTELSISAGTAVCRVDERPTRDVTVRLRNGAPLDAATSLPDYVTGGGNFGVPPGVVRTKVYVYLPAASDVYEVRVDGASVGFLLAEHDGVPVVAVTVDNPPDARTVIRVLSIAPEGDSGVTTVLHTPMVGDVPVVTDALVDCRDVAGFGA